VDGRTSDHLAVWSSQGLVGGVLHTLLTVLTTVGRNEKKKKKKIGSNLLVYKRVYTPLAPLPPFPSY